MIQIVYKNIPILIPTLNFIFINNIYQLFF